MSPRYRPMPGGPWFPLAVFGIFGLATVSMALSMVSGGGPPLAFGVVWLSILAWNAYWFLFGIAGELWVDGPLLRWRAALRSGAVARSARSRRSDRCAWLRTWR